MIYIAADQHGFKVISFVENYLKSHEIPYKNIGVTNIDEDMALEDMIPKVVRGVVSGGENLGILSCGTGVGVEIGANKFSGIRAVLAVNEKVAHYSRVYDDCNILCLVGWDTTKEAVYKILDAWFSAKYDGNEKRRKMFEVFNAWH